MLNVIFILFIYLFLVAPHSLLDLSSLTKDGTHVFGRASAESKPLSPQGVPLYPTLDFSYLLSPFLEDKLHFLAVLFTSVSLVP